MRSRAFESNTYAVESMRLNLPRMMWSLKNPFIILKSDDSEEKFNKKYLRCFKNLV